MSDFEIDKGAMRNQLGSTVGHVSVPTAAETNEIPHYEEDRCSDMDMFTQKKTSEFSAKEEHKMSMRRRQKLHSKPGMSDLTAEVTLSRFGEDFPTCDTVTLYNKRDNRPHTFKIYEERDLPFLSKPLDINGASLNDFNMEKLEQEYDYDTDEDQLCAA